MPEYPAFRREVFWGIWLVIVYCLGVYLRNSAKVQAGRRTVAGLGPPKIQEVCCQLGRAWIGVQPCGVASRIGVLKADRIGVSITPSQR